MFNTYRVYVGNNERILAMQQILSLIYRHAFQDVQWGPEPAESTDLCVITMTLWTFYCIFKIAAN